MPFTFMADPPPWRDYTLSGEPPSRSLFEQAQAPPTRRVSLADLYRPPEYATAPEQPTYARSLRDLSEEDRKAYRRQAMLKALQAASAGWHQGRAGSALLAAAVEMQGDRADLIEQENRRRDQEYEQARQRAMQSLQMRQMERKDEEDRLAAQSRLSMYERIAELDPELAAQAEGAARGGDTTRLYELMAEARKRQAIREGGYGDPNDPFIDERVAAKMRADEDERKRKAVLESLPEELRLRNSIEDEQLASRIKRGLVRDPNRPEAGEGAPRWEPDTVTLTNPETGEDEVFMVDKSRVGPDGKPLMTKLGSARERADKGFTHFNAMDSLGNMRPFIWDPTTGTSRPDPSFVQKTKKERRGGFLGIGGKEVDVPDTAGGYVYMPPDSPPPGPGGGSRSQAPRPSAMLDNPQGAPARGRGDGPAPAQRQPSPQERAGAGRSPEETSAAFARVIQQTGPLPLSARQALKRRLAAGANEEREAAMLREAMGSRSATPQPFAPAVEGISASPEFPGGSPMPPAPSFPESRGLKRAPSSDAELLARHQKTIAQIEQGYSVTSGSSMPGIGPLTDQMRIYVAHELERGTTPFAISHGLLGGRGVEKMRPADMARSLNANWYGPFGIPAGQDSTPEAAKGDRGNFRGLKEVVERAQRSNEPREWERAGPAAFRSGNTELRPASPDYIASLPKDRGGLKTALEAYPFLSDPLSEVEAALKEGLSDKSRMTALYWMVTGESPENAVKGILLRQRQDPGGGW